MEGHPSKRRRVEHENDQATGDFRFNQGRERAGSLSDRREKLAIPKLVLPAHHAFGVHGASRQKVQHLLEPQDASQSAPSNIQPRQLVGTQVTSVAQGAPETASTVLAIAIDNGQGIVSEMEVPMASKSVWIQGYGELTMATNGPEPTITASMENNPSNSQAPPGTVTPPPAIAASQARDQALQSQEAIAKQLNVVPQGPSTAAQPSSPSAPAPSQSPVAASTPESRSQQVLSSPPTPLPATPPLSSASSASYFTSSPSSMPNSSPPLTPNPSTTSSPNNSPIAASSNSTLSATSSFSSSAIASLSLSSSSSGAILTASSISSQSAALHASSSSAESLAALTSTSRNPSGFTTSTLRSQTLSPGSSTLVTPTSTTLGSSALSLTSNPSSASALSASQTSSQAPSGSLTSGSPSSTGGGAGGIGGTGNTASALPTATPGAGSGGSSTPPASVLAGGIVGGVAGATILVLILVLLFRWRRGKMAERRTISPPIPQTIGPGGVPQPGNMTQRSSITPIAGAGFFGRLRPASSQTATSAETGPSERGFQKISGRKLPSVLTSGGDGYGDNAAAGPSAAPAPASASTNPTGPAGSRSQGVAPGQGPFAGLAPALRPGSPNRSLSGSSFYRDSHGFYGGIVPESTTQAETDISSSPSTSPSYPAPLNISDRSQASQRQPEVAITRPGPARTPVINQPGVVPIRSPSRANQPPPRLARGTPPPQTPFRDGLGRSHPSQDGSRGSRFREDTTPP